MKLGNILTYKKGKAPQKIEQSDNYVIYLSPEYLRGKAKPTLIQDYFSKVSVNSEDLLLLWDGSNAGEFFKGREGVLSSTMVKFNFDPKKHNRNFLFYQLKNFEDYLKSQTNGSGIPHVDKEILLGLNVHEFASSEQTCIAQILSQADEAIAHTEALIAKYQRIKTGLMQDLLTRGIDEQGQIRSEATHPFKDSPLGRIPEEWEVKTLGDYSKLYNHLRKPISAIERATKQGHYPYYGATGIIDYLNEYRVEGKFVLIGEDGDHFLKFGKQNMTNLVNGRFNVSNHAHILSGNEECKTEWIHYFYCNRDITYFLTRQGASRFKLNKASLLNLPFCVPSLDEQRRIILNIESLEESKKLVLDNLAKLQSIKRGLMQDLLSGRVRVGTPQTNEP